MHYVAILEQWIYPHDKYTTLGRPRGWVSTRSDHVEAVLGTTTQKVKANTLYSKEHKKMD